MIGCRNTPDKRIEDDNLQSSPNFTPFQLAPEFSLSRLPSTSRQFIPADEVTFDLLAVILNRRRSHDP